MILQVGVKVLLKNGEGKFLLARRNPKKYPETGSQWDIIGGRIEPGTDLITNLKREVLEEIGLNLTSPVTLVAAQDIILNHGYGDEADSAEAKNQKHVVRLTYVGQIEGSPIISEESTEAKWFTAEEIKNLAQGELDKFVRELINQNKVLN